jgi:hypothetical protein
MILDRVASRRCERDGREGDMSPRPGISNRETADEEARARREHPRLTSSLPPVEDVAGAPEDPADLHKLADRDRRSRVSAGLQTSRKAGSRSLSQKEDDSRHPDSPAPAARRVAGAFGRERPAAARRRKP